MRSFLPLIVYCISLVSLPQLKALPAQERPDSNRFTELINMSEEKATAPESQSDVGTPSPAPGQYPTFLASLLGRPPASEARTSSPGLPWLKRALRNTGKAPRVRRHAHSGLRGAHHYPHHPQLMRVGCVLGTCQVQNLSHRLYQLLGQNGREDSSPINPRSPHSYG